MLLSECAAFGNDNGKLVCELGENVLLLLFAVVVTSFLQRTTRAVLMDRTRILAMAASLKVVC